MRSIEARFKKSEKKHVEWSSYIVFADAILGQRFCKDRLVRHFNKLVEIDDYEKADKKAILKFLLSLTNTLRSTEFEVFVDPQGVEDTKDEYLII